MNEEDKVEEYTETLSDTLSQLDSATQIALLEYTLNMLKPDIMLETEMEQIEQKIKRTKERIEDFRFYIKSFELDIKELELKEKMLTEVKSEKYATSSVDGPPTISHPNNSEAGIVRNISTLGDSGSIPQPQNKSSGKVRKAKEWEIER